MIYYDPNNPRLNASSPSEWAALCQSELSTKGYSMYSASTCDESEILSIIEEFEA